MTELSELAKYYYKDEKYNCSEAVLHAANDYYHLNIAPDDMKMIGGFGAGMYSGYVCGALSASVAAVSKILIRDRARNEMDIIKPAVKETVRIFQEHLGDVGCPQLREKNFTKEEMCLKTVMLAAEALQEAVSRIQE